MHASRTRSRFFVPGLSVLAALLLVACSGSSAPEPEEGNGAIRAPITDFEVRPRELSRPLSLSSPVRPLQPVRLSSRTAGTLSTLHVDVGDVVSAGQLLAELDTDEQRAELARVRARAEEARAAHARAVEMRERELLSEADFQAARSQLGTAEAEEQLWRTRVGFGRVLAPVAGTVTARHAEHGESVEAGQTLFELADMHQLVLHLGVSELDVIHLARGDRLPVRLDAMPGLELDGRVRRVFPSADPGSRLVTVEVALPEDAFGHGVRPGFLARVDTRIDQRDGVLAVPSAAVGEDNGQRYVFLVADGQLHRRVVEPGASRGDWTEIVSGIDEGDRVLASNPADMRDGQAVRVIRTLEGG
ncbi:MAG: efflux RND transporter periplasmic adaptor subunit [Lysobacteraceae bacterium]